jgi:hypothetical protein
VTDYQDDRNLAAARGFVFGLALSLVLWAVIGAVILFLVRS